MLHQNCAVGDPNEDIRRPSCCCKLCLTSLLCPPLYSLQAEKAASAAQADLQCTWLAHAALTPGKHLTSIVCAAVSTLASRGQDHHKSASQHAKAVDSFRLSKFESVPHRVDTHLHDPEVSFWSRLVHISGLVRACYSCHVLSNSLADLPSLSWNVLACTFACTAAPIQPVGASSWQAPPNLSSVRLGG